MPPITLEHLKRFTAPMLSRNPKSHYVFSRMGMAEEMGFGLKLLKNRAEQLALPLPRYSWENPYLVLTLYRSPEASTKSTGSGRTGIAEQGRTEELGSG